MSIPSQPAPPNGTGTTTTAAATTNTPPPAPPRINTVTYRNATIKAQIDTTMMVSDVIRQLCANAHLGVQEPPALFALRDEDNDELVEDSNLARKIQQGRSFKLTASPLIEAAEMVDKLSSPDDKILKMATYTLQRLIREPAFTAEFLRRGGLQELVSLVHALNSGNTLAYALTSCQNLFETNDVAVWQASVGGEFIAKVVRILVSQERINVCRPATAILKKLVVSSSTPSKQPDTPQTPSTPSSSPHGFQAVYEKINKEPAFLTTLVHRLSSPDATLCLYSLSLLNSLMRHVTESLFDDFTSELEKLGTSKAVARLMDSHRGEELSTSILEYQSNVVRVLHRRLRTAVTPTDKRHVTALTYLWRQASITEEVVPPAEDPVAVASATTPTSAATLKRSSSAGTATKYKWRRLGFTNENVAKDFAATGWLGLECCEAYVRADPEAYAQTILEQINRPPAKSCPWGRASTEVVEILADHWDISSGYTTATKFMPFLLSFQRVHQLALRFFLRMWTDCNASTTAGDFPRVSAMVRSQVKEALSDEGAKSWFDVESSFLESEYRSVRERQMKELQVEDDFASRASIRGLRNRLYRESYEFVRQQRIQCLLEGAWFKSEPGTQQREHRGSITATSMRRNTLTSSNHTPNPLGSWSFYRLSPNKRYLHYTESSEPHAFIRSGLDDLTERLDLSQVTDVVASSGETTFTLLRSQDTSICTLTAQTPSQYSEWIDGLSMLLGGESATVHTQETAEYIQALTDIAVRVKLLDLTGEKLDVPEASVAPPGLPVSLDFFFAEL